MKRTTMMTALLAVAGLMTATAGFGAEAAAKIPFDFEANGGKLAAGSYRVFAVGSLGASGIYEVRSADGKHSVLMTSQRWTSPGREQAQIKFQCAGERCQLAELRLDAERVVRFPVRK